MPGRPNLYGTTSDFLDYFGLSTINDLPKLPTSVSSTDEGELFNSIYKEEKNEVPTNWWVWLLRNYRS